METYGRKFLGRHKFPSPSWEFSSASWEAELGGRSLQHRQFVSCCKFLDPCRSSSLASGLAEMFTSPLPRVIDLLTLA